MLSELIQTTPAKVRNRLVVAVLLSSAAHTSMSVLILSRVHAGEEESLRLLLMLWLAGALYVLSLRECTGIISSLIESALFKLRERLADKVRRADLLALERIGTAQLYSRVAQATSIISNNALTVALAVASLGTLLFLTVYVAFLSMPTLLLVLTFYGGGGTIFYLRKRRIRISVQKADVQHSALFRILDDLLRGSKELRLHKRRSDALMLQIGEMAAALRTTPIEVNDIMRRNFIFARMFLFGLLAAIVFVLPEIVPIHRSQISMLVPVSILLFAPLTDVIHALTDFERIDIAAASLDALEERLNLAIPAQPKNPSAPWSGPISELCAQELIFHHVDEAGNSMFSIGPISFSIRAGSITFFTGGNGAGKTTLLKLLTSLYTPAAGSLLLDGIPITQDNVSAYREMITAIFADFHLFRKLYGFADVTDRAVIARIEQMQIQNSTTFVKGVFTNLELSTGQRKRLAMVVALLEDRPIFVFDEWAADQDPSFRNFFYEELLPDLRRRGKTVLVISHDDRYFHVADQILVIEDGRIRNDQQRTQSIAISDPSLM